MKNINKTQLKIDINLPQSIISNKDLLEKYKFKTNLEMFDYARKHNLMSASKPFSEEELRNLKLISRFLKNPFGDHSR